VVGRRGSRAFVIATIRAQAELLIKQIVLDIVANLRRAASEGGSPVDTGWLRANWVASIGEPFDGTVGTREQAEQGNVDNARSEQSTQEFFTNYGLNDGSGYVSNNVPYVLIRNERGGKVAQKFFVQRAIKEAVDRARGKRFR
jgi:hypothetical protein